MTITNNINIIISPQYKTPEDFIQQKCQGCGSVSNTAFCPICTAGTAKEFALDALKDDIKTVFGTLAKKSLLINFQSIIQGEGISRKFLREYRKYLETAILSDSYHFIMTDYLPTIRASTLDIMKVTPDYVDESKAFLVWLTKHVEGLQEDRSAFTIAPNPLPQIFQRLVEETQEYKKITAESDQKDIKKSSRVIKSAEKLNGTKLEIRRIKLEMVRWIEQVQLNKSQLEERELIEANTISSEDFLRLKEYEFCIARIRTSVPESL